MKTTPCRAIAVAAALSLGVAAPFFTPAAAAQDQQRPGLLDRIRDKLGLTDDQIAKIRAEWEPERAKLKELAGRLRQAQSELRQQIHSAEATDDAVRAASAKVAAVEADLAVERHRLYAKVRPLLNSEQLEKVKDFGERLDDWFNNAINRFGEGLKGQ